MTDIQPTTETFSVWRDWPLTKATPAKAASQAGARDDKPDDQENVDQRDIDRASGADETVSSRKAALELRRKDQLRALETLAKAYPDFIAGLAPPGLDVRGLKRVFLEVCKDMSTVRERVTFNFLVKGTENMARTRGWNLAVPAPLTEVRNTASAFMPSTFRSLPAVGRLREAVQGAATDPAFYRTEDNPYLQRAQQARRRHKVRHWATLQGLHLGQILASVVLFGGALSRPIAGAILDSVADGPRIHGDLLWLRLHIRPPSKRRQARRLHVEREEGAAPEFERRLFRRYFPDPLSGLLILKYARTYREHIGIDYQHLDELLRFYLASIDHGLEQIPNLGALIQMALQHAAIIMPASLVEYASNVVLSRSVPENTWLRVRRQLAAPQAPEQEQTAHRRQVQEKRPRASGYPDQYAALVKLRSQLPTLHKAAREKDPEKAKALEAQIDWDRFCPMLYAVGQWCRYLADPKTAQGRNLRTTTLKSYLSRIGKRLLSFGLEFDPQDADETDFNELYLEVLDTIDDPVNQRGVGKRLIDFHSFLVRTMGAPPVSIGHGPLDFSSVDANFITETEYQHALTLLRERRGSSHAIAVMRCLMLVLGYRAGLRRGEVKYLRIKDIHIAEAPFGRSGEILSVDLVLRSHPTRRLKTRNAQRRLPLHVLLTGDELGNFVAFVKHRRTQGDTQGDPLLFAQPTTPFVPIHEDETFTPIRQALQAATGDPNVRFHHPRHSFPNVTLFRLWRLCHPEIFTNAWVPFLKDLPFDASQDKLLWRHIVDENPDAPTRKLLFAVSTAMGHADPGSTLANYWHFFDVALGRFLETNAGNASIAAQAMLLGIPVQMLRVERSKAGVDDERLAHAYTVAKRRARRTYPEDVPQNASKYRPGRLPAEAAESTDRSWPSIFTMNSAFEAYRSTPIGAGFKQRCQIVADATGSSAFEVERWIRLAKIAASIDGPRRQAIHRTYDGDMPRIPRTKDRRREAMEVYDTLMRHATDRAVGTIAKEAIIFFIYSGNAYDVFVHAKDPRAALQMSQSFRAAGIDPKRIEIRICGAVIEDVRKTTAVWADYLDMPGIRLRDSDTESDDKSESGSKSKSKGKGKGKGKGKRASRVRRTDDRRPVALGGVSFYVTRKGRSRTKRGTRSLSKNEIQSLRYAFQMAAIASGALDEIPNVPRDSDKLPADLRRYIKGYLSIRPKGETKASRAEAMGQTSMDF